MVRISEEVDITFVRIEGLSHDLYDDLIEFLRIKMIVRKNEVGGKGRHEETKQEFAYFSATFYPNQAILVRKWIEGKIATKEEVADTLVMIST